MTDTAGTTGEGGSSPPDNSRPLAGKRVVLGVCGGIAAYKAVEVCRRLSDAGALVSPVLTQAATRFVGAVTFSALAAEPAQISLYASSGSGDGPPVPHVALGRQADAIVVAPATARLIGSYAAGISSDLLTATLLATRAPVLLCPAMHTEMWEHAAVQHNMAVLRQRGVHVVGPDEGRLAGGDSGPGRLSAPEDIVQAVVALFSSSLPEAADRADDRAGDRTGDLLGVQAVVSAGGTREPIDAVRYIGNRSSGKQGFAIAAELAARGARVTLVTSSELVPPPGAEVVEVETAAEMASAVLEAAAGADVVVMAAAVADYRPAAPAAHKLHKSAAPLVLELVATVDVLATLGTRRAPGQVLVGFAAETASGPELVEQGRAKLAAKGADIIVANDVSAPGAGFGHDQSAAVIVSRHSVVDLGLVGKRAVATMLVDAIASLLRTQGAPGSQEGQDGQRGTKA
jgi:phosphopantothenoylcysteine decarboxylase/phosphopantothenate--cysteine ligase